MLAAERAKHETLQKQLQDAGMAHATAVKALEEKLKDSEEKVDRLLHQENAFCRHS